MKEYQQKKNNFLRTQFIILLVWTRWLEKQNLFREDKLKMNFQSNIQKIQTFRISVAILNDVEYSICSSLDFECRLLVMIIPQERAPRQKLYLFKVNNRNTGKKCENYSKLTIKTAQRLSTELLTLDIILSFFQCPAVNFEQVNVPPYQFINVEITLLQLLTYVQKSQ